MNKMWLILFPLLFFISGCDSEKNIQSKEKDFQQQFWIEDYTKNLNFPWAITWLPNNDLLITERLGKIKLARNGKVISEIEGVPEVMACDPLNILSFFKIRYMMRSHKSMNFVAMINEML
jgi:glucose/arabinose dehydrogenase